MNNNRSMKSSCLDKDNNQRFYLKPRIRLAGLDDDLLGIIDASGGQGPGVDTDNPVEPDDPHAGLTNTGSIWDKEN